MTPLNIDPNTPFTQNLLRTLVATIPAQRDETEADYEERFATASAAWAAYRPRDRSMGRRRSRVRLGQRVPPPPSEQGPRELPRGLRPTHIPHRSTACRLHPRSRRWRAGYRPRPRQSGWSSGRTMCAGPGIFQAIRLDAKPGSLRWRTNPGNDMPPLATKP